MASWVPNQDAVQQLATLLSNTLASDNAVRRASEAQLQQFAATVPDMCNYLVFILTSYHGSSNDDPVRSSAGIHLKNTIIHHSQRIAPAVISYVQSALLSALNDRSLVIRGLVGSIIAALLRDAKFFETWNGFLSTAAALLSSQETAALEGATDMLRKVVEDSPQKFREEPTRPLTVFIPLWINLLSHQSDRVKLPALQSLLCFVASPPVELQASMPHFIQGLSAIASSTSHPAIIEAVIRAFILLLATPQYLSQALPNICQFVLYYTTHSEESVAMTACDFWGALASTEGAQELLVSMLPQVVPLLLQSMRFSDMELQFEGGIEIDDSAVPDAADTLNPQSYMHTFKSSGAESQAASSTYDEDEDEDEEEGDAEQANSVRRVAAASLDSIASTVPEQLLPVLMQHIQAGLGSGDWRLREACILALGAVADGCYDLMVPSLPAMIPFLWENARHGYPPIIRISTWALGKYCRFLWASNEHVTTYFGPTMELVRSLVLHPDKRVQKAACTSITAVLEEAPIRLLMSPGVIEPLVTTLADALVRYQAKNMIVLLDCVSVLFDSTRPELAQRPDLALRLANPVLSLVGGVSIQGMMGQDPLTVPILEVASTVLGALGPLIAPNAPAILARIISLITESLPLSDQLITVNEDYYGFERVQDSIACLFEMVSSLCESLGPSVESALAPQIGPLLNCVVAACRGAYSVDDVVMTSLGALGDIIRVAPGHVLPQGLDGVMQLLLQVAHAVEDKDLTDTDDCKIVNNVLWVAGYVAKAVPPEMMAPFRGQILGVVNMALSARYGSLALRKTACTTVGRMALADPSISSDPAFGALLKDWFICQREPSQDAVERADAWAGIGRAINANLGLLSPVIVVALESLGMVVGGRYDLPEEALSEWRKVMGAIKVGLQPAVYQQLMTSLNERWRKELANAFQL